MKKLLLSLVVVLMLAITIRSALGACALPSCSGNCEFYDDFNEDSGTCDLRTLGWTVSPIMAVYPTSGKLYIPTNPPNYMNHGFSHANYADTTTIQFDLSLSQESQFYFEFLYYDSTLGEHRMPVHLAFDCTDQPLYGITISTWEGQTAYSIFNGQYIADCGATPEEFHVTIVLFNYNAEGYIFYNGTSQQNELIHPNTFAVFIDNNKAEYNLPMYENLTSGNSNMMDQFVYSFGAGERIDNQRVDLFSNFTQVGPFCTDTDSGSYPTVDYFEVGTAGVNSTTGNDCCVTPGTSTCTANPTTMLKEFRCDNPYDNHIHNSNYNCTGSGSYTCVNGECVACTPDWSCSAFTECVGGEKNCTAVEDLNDCAMTFGGNLHDYDQLCGFNISCTDTDSASYPTTDYFEKGFQNISAEGFGEVTGWDACVNSTTLNELWCATNTSSEGNNTYYDCANNGGTCSDGACIGGGINGTNCTLPDCTGMCYFKDYFSYNCSVADTDWYIQLYNVTDVYPDNFQLCYNAVDQIIFSHNTIGQFFTQVVTDEFDVTIPDTNNAEFFHQLVYYDSTDMEWKVPYVLDFYYSQGVGVTLSVYEGESLVSVAGDVFDVGVKNHVRVVSFNFDTDNRVFYNTTSQQYQSFLPNTYSIIINEDPAKSYYNLPMYQPLIYGHSNMISSPTYYWSGGYVCMDNVNLYGGTNFTQQQQTCIDTDSQTYPTRDYFEKGTTIGGTVGIDCCVNQQHQCTTSSSTMLREYYCNNQSDLAIYATEYNCAIEDKICYEGKCVDECQAQEPTNYTWPTLWLEEFRYFGDAITDHGWTGYPFVVGDNIYDNCQFFYDIKKDENWITYDFPTPAGGDFRLKWDMALETSTGNNTYLPNGLYADMKLVSGDQNSLIPIHLEWNFDGNITYNYNGTDVVIGNWQGTSDSYKIEANMSSQTFDFYFTNSTQYYSYALGCHNCPFNSDTYIDNLVTIGYEATGIIPPYCTDPNSGCQFGMWLNNINLTYWDGSSDEPTQNVTNFCNFNGCIYHDHFDYVDNTSVHGWYMFGALPLNSYVKYANSTQGYYFEHAFDTFPSANGTITVQFKALFPTFNGTQPDLMNFLLYSEDYQIRTMYIGFGDGIISDNNRGGATIGVYDSNTWNTYSFIINLQANKYDFYIDGTKILTDSPITKPVTAASKVGFWVNSNSSMYLDFVTVARGTDLISNYTGGQYTETGVPSDQLHNCWGANGTFDWTCCTAEEQAEKSFMCPTRVSFFFMLANITQFVLQYFVYFLIIVVLFVILLPFFVRNRGGN